MKTFYFRTGLHFTSILSLEIAGLSAMPDRCTSYDATLLVAWDAYRYQEFHANTLVSGSGGAMLRAFKFRRLSVSPGFAAWYQVARLDLGSQGWQTHQSASLGVFIPSPIGTAGIALSFTQNGKARVRVLLGSF